MLFRAIFVYSSCFLNPELCSTHNMLSLIFSLLLIKSLPIICMACLLTVPNFSVMRQWPVSQAAPMKERTSVVLVSYLSQYQDLMWFSIRRGLTGNVETVLGMFLTVPFLSMGVFTTPAALIVTYKLLLFSFSECLISVSLHWYLRSTFWGVTLIDDTEEVGLQT